MRFIRLSWEGIIPITVKSRGPCSFSMKINEDLLKTLELLIGNKTCSSSVRMREIKVR